MSSLEYIHGDSHVDLTNTGQALCSLWLAPKILEPDLFQFPTSQ